MTMVRLSEHDSSPNMALRTVVAHVSSEVQGELLAQVREVLGVAPLLRPMTPGGVPMRVQVSAAGKHGFVGALDGRYTYADHHPNGKPWPEIPVLWANIADEIAGPHPWDSAILNWYDKDAGLGWHRDKSERDLSLPIVTISLGDAASWAVREDESSPIHRAQIGSGAITLLAGEQRSWLHTIERIHDSGFLSPIRRRGRVSITMRVAG